MLPDRCRQTVHFDRNVAGAAARRSGALAAVAVSALLAGCGTAQTVDLSTGHLSHEPPPAAAAPPPQAAAPVAPEPVKAAPVATYTVVVKDVPVADLLFSLARDAGLDVDIQAAADKTVTLNAVERPLPEILSRIAEQANLRYEQGLADYTYLATER